jgi:tmRNA-binding protein
MALCLVICPDRGGVESNLTTLPLERHIKREAEKLEAATVQEQQYADKRDTQARLEQENLVAQEPARL